MRYSLMTDKGKMRRMNQDNCFIACPDAASCFAIVCDGMGGSNAGDTASEIAVKIISERITAAWRQNMSEDSVKNLLTTAITAANICVYDKSLEDEAYAGMGTTVVAAVIRDGRLIVAHAGDSRAYIVTDELKCVTKDHSLVQKMVDDGTLTAEEAKSHPDKHYITRALGIEEKIEIDFSVIRLTGAEKILLCSDGLTNFVGEEELLSLIASVPIEEVAEKLVDLANQNGGGDNVTAVVISE